MAQNVEAELLREIPAFRELTSIRRRLLAVSCQRVEFRAGTDIIKQGDAGEHIFVILSGEADVHLNDGDDQRFVRKVGENDIVGEVAATGERTRSASVTACDKVVALRIGAEVLAQFIKEAPELESALRKHGESIGYVYD
jgi:CRP-like cAMP-binding protein